ncbi:MAG: LytTR family transcriptional regulator DNA-binding domain-containing protein [Muribaculaceae bacterium]|nr:LytTR family transcriptional regulator DNA-binding domain-containing protein [Muribaculaceae bacterium]
MALAIFKPFGLDAWQWETYAHLLGIGVLGFSVCLVSDGILKLIGYARSNEFDVSYIIHRNLLFQLINTPLVALMICLYRHFLLSDSIKGNLLSWGNFFETLLIIAFCSFAIGLYWRFKFRSRYLATELEETRMLNERLQLLQQANTISSVERHPNVTDLEPDSPTLITLKGTTSETIALKIADLLYVEAVGNYVKVVHLLDGEVHSDMLRSTSKQMEENLRSYPKIVRCHRAFLVNLQQVERIISQSGTMQLLIKHCHDSLPVSRSNISQVKEAIKGV